MAKIDEVEMYNDLDFKCERCGRDAQKVSKLEADLGYVSKVNGEFVKVCQDCWNDLPDADKAMKPVFETMFLIGIPPDGGAPVITEEGIETPYKRSPSPYEIKAACQDIADNIASMNLANRIGGLMVQIIQQTQHLPQPVIGQPMMMPRKKTH